MPRSAHRPARRRQPARSPRRPTNEKAEPREATVGQLLGFLCPGIESKGCPWWPPDVFALAASVLLRTGAYVGTVELSATGAALPLPDGWPQTVAVVAHDWREAINRDDLSARPPEQVLDCWRALGHAFHKPLAEVARDVPLTGALLQLCTTADAASEGLGLEEPATGAETFAAIAHFIATGVEADKPAQSFCFDVRPDRVRVLPKQHTPQLGLTLRSLSHHLALLPATGVDTFWYGPYGTADPDVRRRHINLLLLPWPLDVPTTSFTALRRGRGMPTLADRSHFFEYRHPGNARSPKAFESRLCAVIAAAKAYAQPIDAVIFPELALKPDEYDRAERVALRERALLVAGVAETGPPPRNACYVQPAGLTPGRYDAEILERLRIEQGKHHRWRLERNQILQYGLGGQLSASQNYWEYTRIGRRTVSFVTFEEWATMAFLVCEDLARQDPVADVLRAVGPNLVVALLMDGPQLSNRWGARYASVLAEDPGSSVLTLTSLGMSNRSVPATGQADRRRTIALWRDALYGERELALPPECDAAVLSLAAECREEFSLDGRSDRGAAYTPVFGGFHPFRSQRGSAV